MIKTIRLQYDIELSPDDLRTLARAAGIMEEITSIWLVRVSVCTSRFQRENPRVSLTDPVWP